MRKSTLSLLAIIVAVALSGCSSESTPDEHLASAKEYMAAGNSAAAVLELKNALQKDGSMAEARWLLGRAYLAAGDTASAEKELERAMWMDWSPDEVVPAYAAALLGQQKYAEIDKLSDDGLGDDSRASLYTSKAMAMVARNQNQDAKAFIEKTLEIQPDSAAARLAKAKLEINLGDIEKADATLETVLAQDANNAEAWHALGEVALLQRDPEKAGEALDKTLKIEPGNVTALYQRAITALQTEDYKVARRSAAQLLRRKPKDPGANFIQGYLDLRARQPERAAKRLGMAEPLTQEYPQIALFLAIAELENDNLEIASAAADRFNALVPDSIRGRKVVATIRLREGEAAKAEDAIRPVTLAAPEDVEALQLLASALLQQNKTEEGLSVLSQVAQLRPDSAQAKARLGAGLLLNGQPEDAKLQLESALQLNPEIQQADLLLVLTLLEQGEEEKALATAQALAEKQPDESTPLNLVGWVHARMGNIDLAEKTYRQILQKAPNDPGANHSLAQIALQSSDYATATKHYEAILADKPDHLPTHIQLALIDAMQNNNDAVIARLQSVIEKHPEALQPRIILARYYLRTNRAEQVSTAFLGLNEMQRRTPEVLQLTALSQVVGQEHSEALYTLEKLNASEPNSAANHYLTAIAAAGAGDSELAQSELQAALELDPDHHPSRLALAKLYWGLQRHDKLEPQLKILTQALPDNAEVLLLQAAAHQYAGDSAAAVATAEKAHKLSPTTNSVVALGTYYEETGNEAAARTLYQGWLKDHPSSSVVRLKLAEEEMNAGGDAAQQYLKIIESEPKNIVALNNLAWVLREDNPEQALTYAQRANEAAPDTPAVLDTLALVELANGNLVQATRTVRRALELAPDQPSILYHRAIIEKANGQIDEALYTLETLFASGKEFPEAQEAQALYDTMKK